MAITPAINMDNPFHGTFECEGDSLQYHAVIPGTDEYQVKEMTGGAVGDGTIIAGVLQDDQDDGEQGKVVYFGPTWAIAQGAITRDNVVTAIYSAIAAENGRFSFVDSNAIAAGKMLSGIALEDAEDGGVFKLFLDRRIQIAQPALN